MKTNTGYFFLIRPIKLKLLHNPKVVEEIKIGYNAFMNTFSLSKDVYPTGLSSPHPEELLIIVGNKGAKFLISKEDLENHFDAMPQVEANDKFMTTQDIRTSDNCWNQPKEVIIPKGTLIEATESDSGNRGDYFFKVGDQRLRLSYSYVPHPYGMPLLYGTSLTLELVKSEVAA